ncbi:MAG: type I CRISPR-associated protein Cas7 [Syntrophomonadaceae bacterium]|nr:type I CRISPR-associated protein Cas7 [Syntrophomonadaceae bacterium]
MIIKQNSEFLFLFEASMTNPNGDPDQENKPRMDYETSTLLVSDARRKRDCRDFMKEKNYQIFVDTIGDNKIPMDKMFAHIIELYFKVPEKIEVLKKNNPDLDSNWMLGKQSAKYQEEYNELKKDKKIKTEFTRFNNLLLTEIIKDSLIDIRLFGSAMAVEGVSRTYTGPVQMNWGYSLHPVELVKSNTITSIMNEDNSTFGKKHKVHYALVAHYGTINKFSARKTGMTEADRDIFRKALVQGMMNQQTDSKQGQIPLLYLEIVYQDDFDGYLGDLRRFIDVDYDGQKPIRNLKDLQKVDFSRLDAVIKEMKSMNYVQEVIVWKDPFVNKEIFNLMEHQPIDLWKAVPVQGA